MAGEPTTLWFNAVLDGEAAVWVATGTDRISTEAPTREALLDRLKAIVPDVLEAREGRAVRDVKIVLREPKAF